MKRQASIATLRYSRANVCIHALRAAALLLLWTCSAGRQRNEYVWQWERKGKEKPPFPAQWKIALSSSWEIFPMLLTASLGQRDRGQTKLSVTWPQLGCAGTQLHTDLWRLSGGDERGSARFARWNSHTFGALMPHWTLIKLEWTSYGVQACWAWVTCWSCFIQQKTMFVAPPSGKSLKGLWDF